MASKTKTFPERLREYHLTVGKERRRLKIEETTVIGFPDAKPGFIGNLAVWLLRGCGAQIQIEYRDTKK